MESMLMMGFERVAVEAAWDQSPIKTVEGLLDWIDGRTQQPFVPATGPPASSATSTPPVPFVPPAATPAPPAANTNVEQYVDAQSVQQLVDQDRSLVVAQKAVLFSGNKGVDAALAWLEAHKDDKDLEEPVSVDPKPQLSAEEAALRARLLQDQIRGKIKEEEAKSQFESEKLRLKMGKEASEARRIQDEQRKAHEMELYLRERKRDEQDRDAILHKLEQDKRERFGDKYTAATAVSEKSAQVKLSETYDKMYKISRMGQLRELHTCLSTLVSVVGRILANPQDAQLRQINASNPNFCQRVTDVVGAVHLLTLMGFEEKEGFYIMEQPDLNLLRDFQEFLQQKTNYLSTQF